MGSADSADAGTVLRIGSVFLAGGHLPPALPEERSHLVLLRSVALLCT